MRDREGEYIRFLDNENGLLGGAQRSKGSGTPSLLLGIEEVLLGVANGALTRLPFSLHFAACTKDDRWYVRIDPSVR